MAEAIPLPSLNISNKYFCYQCDREVFLFQSSELLCPECRGDFIEEVTDDHDDVDYEEDSDVDESEHRLLTLLSAEHLFRRVLGEDLQETPRHASHESSDEVESHEEEQPISELVDTTSNLLHQVGFHLSGERIRLVGEYLFGDDIDAISTMLLDETEVVGPAPLPKDQIKLLPMIAITKDDVEKEVQCTICMEDFVIREKAKSLPCSHFYHEKCITQWLERHATCPNCRKPVEIQSKNRRSKSCPRTEFSIRNADQRRSSESMFSGFATSSVNPFRFL